MRRLLGPLLLVLLVGGVGYAIYRSGRETSADRAAARQAAAMVTVRGLSGSEKMDYLTDPRVVARFRAKGIDLHVEKGAVSVFHYWFVAAS